MNRVLGRPVEPIVVKVPGVATLNVMIVLAVGALDQFAHAMIAPPGVAVGTGVGVDVTVGERVGVGVGVNVGAIVGVCVGVDVGVPPGTLHEVILTLSMRQPWPD